MFIAMNRFEIALGHEGDFEEVWRNRDSHLDGVPGFNGFKLLKGPSNDEFTLYASHSTWESRAAFEAWTESDAFRMAHSGANPRKGTYMGHPKLETFEAIL